MEFSTNLLSSHLHWILVGAQSDDHMFGHRLGLLRYVHQRVIQRGIARSLDQGLHSVILRARCNRLDEEL